MQKKFFPDPLNEHQYTLRGREEEIYGGTHHSCISNIYTTSSEFILEPGGTRRYEREYNRAPGLSSSRASL